MFKFAVIICICLTTRQGFSESAPKYRVATITEVKIHKSADGVGDADTTAYDVSVKVGDAIYVVLCTPQQGDAAVKYMAGRELLVVVGKSSIRYNDLLGQVHEVPRKPDTGRQ